MFTLQVYAWLDMTIHEVFFKVPPKEMIDLCLNTVEVSSKKDLTVKSQFPAVRQSILYDGKKVLLLA